jgi:hypothetical protein
MGKVADNEVIKLRAAFLNNCSVGLIVGGAFVPILSMYGPIPEIIIGGYTIRSLLLTDIAAVSAVAVGFYLRWRAAKVIAKLSD